MNRIIGLDILRSLAILIVLLVHGSYLLPHDLYVLQLTYLPRIDGVSIFFVLSGFLIGGILLKEVNANKTFSFRDLKIFWIRRWFRTAPNYFLTMFILIAFILFNEQSLSSLSYKYFFFLQNFVSPQSSFFIESWSLTIEEWFYLLFPLFIYFISKLNKNVPMSLLISATIFLLVPLLLRIYKFEQGLGLNDYDNEFRKILLFRLDSLMYGVIGAYLYRKYPDLWSRYKYTSLFVGLLLIFLLKLNPLDWINIYRPLIFNYESIATLLLLPFLSELKTTKIRSLDSLFVFISVISYSMYLLNFSIVSQCLIPLSHKALVAINMEYLICSYLDYFAFWILTVSLSYFVYTYFEYPITQLRNRYSDCR